MLHRGAVRQSMGKRARSQSWVWILAWPTAVPGTLRKSLLLCRCDWVSEAHTEGGFTPARKDKCESGPDS